MLVYPEKMAMFYLSMYFLVWVAFTIIYIAGWIGIIASVVYLTIVALRFYVITLIKDRDQELQDCT